jgi:hypothetical protein
MVVQEVKRRMGEDTQPKIHERGQTRTAAAATLERTRQRRCLLWRKAEARKRLEGLTRGFCAGSQGATARREVGGSGRQPWKIDD